MKTKIKVHKDQHSIVGYNSSRSNPRGRPPCLKTKKFGPQPKSMIISQILNDLDKPKKIETKTPEIPIIIDNPIETEEMLPDSTTVTNKLFSCDHSGCEYTSKESSNLTKHKRTHTKEKPYLCDQCSFRTNFVNSLKTHKRLHSDEKPYICEICSYRCNSSSNLKKHQQSHAKQITS